MNSSLTPEMIRSNRDRASLVFTGVTWVASDVFLSQTLRKPQDRQAVTERIFRNAAAIAESQAKLLIGLTDEAIELINRGRVAHKLSWHGVPASFLTVHSFAYYASRMLLGVLNVALIGFVEPDIVINADEMEPAFWRDIASAIARTNNDDLNSDFLIELRRPHNTLPPEDCELFRNCITAVHEEAAAALECLRHVDKPIGKHFHPIFTFAKDLLSRSNGKQPSRPDIAKAYIASLAKLELAKLRKERPGEGELVKHFVDKLRNHKDQWNP